MPSRARAPKRRLFFIVLLVIIVAIVIEVWVFVAQDEGRTGAGLEVFGVFRAFVFSCDFGKLLAEAGLAFGATLKTEDYEGQRYKKCIFFHGGGWMGENEGASSHAP